jgi:molecular chaperone DnaK
MKGFNNMADRDDPILGIDLGTTNSVVSVVRNGVVEVIEQDGNAILPSVVGLDDRGELLVGHPARNQYILFPERTVKSIKRKMGDDVKVTMGSREFSPQEVSSIILKTLKERAERHLGCPVTRAVITVPAFFNELQRDATRAAGELAGLEVVRIINEPTAAALTYKSHPSDPETLLVYDLGGGTFDVSIVKIEQGVVEVLASHGDTHLGGDDFDLLMLNHVCDEFQREHGIDLRQSPVAKSRLLQASENAKIQLSDEAVVKIEEEFIAEKDGTPLHLMGEVTRLQYEHMIEKLVTKTLKHVDDSLSDAKLTANMIDKVLLVGGSTRTPIVQQILAQRLGQPVSSDLHPDLSVAMGAAIQGALIAGIDVGPVLVDITPHTLGILTADPYESDPHQFSPIIHRNSPLPINRTEIYCTMSNGQREARIEVFQGEDEDTRNNQKIGEFLLQGLDDVEAGNQILVRFALDLDGMLKVIATERSTGLERRLIIENAIQKARRDAEEARKSVVTIVPETNRPEDAIEGAAEVLEARELVLRARPLIEKANPEDAEELRDLLERLEIAIASGDVSSVTDARVPLDDLVFYLQDV